jgi:hypothetical protein
MDGVFDFTQKNLRDIEITNEANQGIMLGTGHRILPNSKIRLSQLHISIERFKELLPQSALPQFVRYNLVKLNPIKVNHQAPPVMPPNNPGPNHAKFNKPKDTKDPASVPPKTEEPDNPFSGETNAEVVKALENTPPGPEAEKIAETVKKKEPPKIEEIKAPPIKTAASSKKSGSSKKKTTKKAPSKKDSD